MNATTAASCIVAQLDPKDCPEGIVFRLAEPDQSIERKFFPDWVNATTIPGHVGSWRQFCIVREHDSGRVVLEHSMKDNGTLLTGEPEWADYKIEAEMRQFLDSALSNEDDEFCITARTGIVFRVQTVRRYYQFCMEKFGRFVLYRRRDDQHVALGELAQPLDRGRYYQLRVETEGSRIQCFLDDALAIETTDDAYPSGKVGWRTNTLARLAGMTIRMTEQASARVERAQAERQQQTQRRRREHPQMKLWRELNLGPSRLLAIPRLTPQGASVLLLASPMDTTAWLHGKPGTPSASWLKVVDLDGRTLWQREFAQPVLQYNSVGDPVGDGKHTLACVTIEQLMLLDLAAGNVRASAPLPPTGPHMIGRRTLFRGSTCSPGQMYIVQLQPPPAPKSVLLCEDSSGGGNTVWAYDHNLKLQWTITLQQPSYGHLFSSADVDGDGCDEILAGYTMLDHDGRILWRVEGCEYFDCYLGGRHPDIVHIGKLDGREFSAVIAGGPDGANFVDVHDGRIKARHRIGHAQALAVGNFRPERAGSEVWTFTAWGNWGIVTLFSGAGEELFQFQPFHYCGGMSAVKNWGGTGQDLLFLSTDERLCGLYDDEGHLVVPMPAPFDAPRDPLEFRKMFPRMVIADVQSDGRDELCLLESGILRVYSPA